MQKGDRAEDGPESRTSRRLKFVASTPPEATPTWLKQRRIAAQVHKDTDVDVAEVSGDSVPSMGGTPTAGPEVAAPTDTAGDTATAAVRVTTPAPPSPVTPPALPRLSDFVSAAFRDKHSTQRAAVALAAAASPLTVVTSVPLGTGAAPYYVVTSPKGDRAYVVTTTVAGGGQSLPTSSIVGINTVTNKPLGAEVSVGYVPINGLATTVKPITFSPDGRRVYVTSISQESTGAVSSKVFAIDAATGQLVGTPIALGSGLGASGLVVSPDGGRLYTVNGDGTLSVFDLNNANAPIGDPIALGSSAGFGGPGADIVIATNNAQTVYITDWAEHAVYVLDASTNTISKSITIDGSPVSLALSADNSKLIVNSMRFDGSGPSTNQATLTVIDTASNTVVGGPIVYGDVTSGFGTTGAMSISPDGRYVYTSSTAQSSPGTLSATLWKIDTTSRTATALPVLGLSSVLSADGRRLYVVTAPPGGGTTGSGIAVIDTATNANLGTVAIAGYSSLQAYAISPDGTRLYVGDYTVAGTDISTIAGELTVVNTGTGNPVTPQPKPPLLKVRLAVNTAVLVARQVAMNLIATGTRIVNALLTLIRDAFGRAVIETPESTVELWDRMQVVTGGFFNDGFYIDKVKSATDQKERLVVYIGGTTLSLFNQSGFANTVGWAQQPKKGQVKALQAAVKNNPNIEILLIGFSQGGMDAQNIAANRDKLKLNVTKVITFGSPVVQDPPTRGYDIVHLEADKDPVPDWGRPGLRSKARTAGETFERIASTSRTFWATYNGFFVVHADSKTYRELAQMFDASPVFDDFKKELKVFQGQYVGHYSV
ncbi:hypothetical protein ASG82_22380 [Mycobacterium sp. Soil538]|nr:hypothetical protein ASG82_22380 [Mycobacterium sp. Soil538]